MRRLAILLLLRLLILRRLLILLLLRLLVLRRLLILLLLLRLLILRRLLLILLAVLRRLLLVRLFIYGRLLPLHRIVDGRAQIGRRRLLRSGARRSRGISFGQASVHKEIAAGYVALIFLVIYVLHAGEPRRDDGNFHFVADVAVDARAENDVRGIVYNALHKRCGRLHFVHRKVVAADDVQNDALRAFDGRSQKRAVDRKAHRLDDPVFALCNADAHVRQALIFQDGAHVRKVEVDERGIDDEVGNTADTLFQDLVRNAERVDHRRIFRDDASDLVVRDYDERIDVFFEIFKPFRRVVHALFAFKVERLGDDGDGQNFQIARDLGDDGSSARAGAAAHARGDEQQIGILDRLGEHLFALFGGSPPHFRLGAGAEALGQGRTDLYFCFRFGKKQYLLVRIDGNITCALDARFDHTVDGVVPRAADADDFYPCNAGQIVKALKHKMFILRIR